DDEKYGLPSKLYFSSLYFPTNICYTLFVTPEERSMLEEAVELSRDNNKMLRSIRSASRWARAWRIFYWTVIVVVTLGSYYYIQPYLTQLQNVYSGFQSDISQIKSVTSKIPGF
ncbi:MAG: hypothetical protein WCW14_01205, partial [Candidatus Paceibacterota bacterium]